MLFGIISGYLPFRRVTRVPMGIALLCCHLTQRTQVGKRRGRSLETARLLKGRGSWTFPRVYLNIPSCEVCSQVDNAPAGLYATLEGVRQGSNDTVVCLKHGACSSNIAFHRYVYSVRT